MGQPKQLLKYKGATLVRRAASMLTNSIYSPVAVVIGAEAEAVAAEIDDMPVHAVVNDSWAEGMSSSIIAGLRKLLELEPDLDGVLICLCDQPKITIEQIDRFAETFSKTRPEIIASAYDGVVGVPGLLPRELFGELLNLTGDTGARQIIRDRDVISIEIPEAALDVDTEEDAVGIEDR